MPFSSAIKALQDSWQNEYNPLLCLMSGFDDLTGKQPLPAGLSTKQKSVYQYYTSLIIHQVRYGTKETTKTIHSIKFINHLFKPLL